MNRFKIPYSYGLLLLFLRIMLPEKAVLQLHNHQHTEDRQASNDIGLKLEPKHTHCNFDELFLAGFSIPEQASFNIINSIAADTYLVTYSCVWQFTSLTTTAPRGPPVV